MRKLLIVLLIFVFLLSLLLPFSHAQDESVLSIGQESFARNFGEVTLPESFVQPIRLIFSIPLGEDITLSYLIVLIAMYIFMLLVVLSLIQFVPFFSGAKAWIGAIVISLLISISGGVRESATFLLSFNVNLGKLASVWFVFLALILIVLDWGWMRLLKMVKDKVGVEVSEQMGLDLSVKPLMEKLKEKRA